MSRFDRIADISLDYEKNLAAAMAESGRRRDCATPDGVACARSVLKVVNWDAIWGDDLPAPLALLVFDYSVLMSWQDATKLLARALGSADDAPVLHAFLKLIETYVRQGALPALLRDFQARAMLALVDDPIWGIAAPQVADRLCGTLSIAMDWAVNGDKHAPE